MRKVIFENHEPRYYSFGTVVLPPGRSEHDLSDKIVDEIRLNKSIQGVISAKSISVISWGDEDDKVTPFEKLSVDEAIEIINKTYDKNTLASYSKRTTHPAIFNAVQNMTNQLTGLKREN